ncbi:hypothetical protein ACH4VR_19500 [Streptomyces sp. NPDC020883]|uniref:hypothetical protein n=1 Tax=Streptomyces sp. NPDC020883 TaxID=3365099 RepID=UPI0037B9E859
MAEGLQAGRLEVPVVANLAGFARDLRVKVEGAAEGLAAKVKIKVDDSGLRERIQAAVDKAQAGISAKIQLRVDHERLRHEMSAAAREAASHDISVPLRPDENGRGRGDGLTSRLRSLIGNAQNEAQRHPVDVPVQFRMPRRRRGGFRSLALGALVSLAQPATSALMQLGAGLTAVVSAAAPAVGMVGALPGLIAGVGTAAIGTRVAFAGFGEGLKQTLSAQRQLAAGTKLTKGEQQKLSESMKDLSASARKTVTSVGEVTSAWKRMRQSVQERFFSQVAGEVRPLSNAVLPMLSRTLGDASDQMGGLVRRGSQFLQSGPFREDFRAIAGTNSRVIGSMVLSVRDLGLATVDFLVASGPFVERIARGTAHFTAWVRASVLAGRETGTLARFMDRAGDKGAQLGRMTRDLTGGLVGMGRASTHAGNSLLSGAEAQLARFNVWANSVAGQKRMSQYFEEAKPGFRELIGLIGDIGRGLVKVSTDNGLVNLVAQIRGELLPALGGFLDVIGRQIGPTVISLGSGVARFVQQLSGAASGLAAVGLAFIGLVNVVNTLLRVVPGLSTALSYLLATMVALKVVRGVTSMVGSLGTAIRSVGTASTAANGAVGPQISLWQRMGLAYRAAAQDAGGVTGAMRGVSAAAGAGGRGLRGVLGGLAGFMGGPLGIAVTVAGAALAVFANKQRAAAEAAQQHKQNVRSLADALKESQGAIDANVRAATIKMLRDNGIAESAKRAGVSLRELTNATLEQGGSIEALQRKMRELAKAEPLARNSWGQIVTSDRQKALEAFARDLDHQKGLLKEAQELNRENADAMESAGTRGRSAYAKLTQAIDEMSKSTSDADSRVKSLKDALDGLTGGSRSAQEAQARLNATLLDVKDSIKAGFSKSDGWGAKDLLSSLDGSLQTTTRNGQKLQETLFKLKDDAADTAMKAFDLARSQGEGLPAALAKGQAAMENARTSAINMAMAMNLNKDEAAALVTQMGLVPQNLTMVLQSQGIPQAQAEVIALSSQLAGLDGQKTKTITISAPTSGAIEQLRSLGFEVQALPGGKQVTVSAPTGAARSQLQALAADIANTPNSKKVTVQAIVAKATGDLEYVRNYIGSMKGKTLVMEAPTQLAQTELKNLGYKIKDLKGKKVEITAPTGTPLSQVQRIQQSINSLTGKTITVTIRYNSEGKPSVVSSHADGGIVRYANGGIRGAGNRIKAFAAGAERHVAQIARPGEWRLWAEPETGGEAYVPLSPAKRNRSKQIVEQVVREFGGVVAWANGTLRQYADGAVTLNRSTRAAAPRSAVTPTGTPALIGGDLNLTMTSQPMNPGEALNNAMFELRRIRRGGVHVATG